MTTMQSTQVARAEAALESLFAFETMCAVALSKHGKCRTAAEMFRQLASHAELVAENSVVLSRVAEARGEEAAAVAEWKVVCCATTVAEVARRRLAQCA
jgi:hypothetical protein